MGEWLTKISNFFKNLAIDFLQGLVDLFRDIALWIFDGVLSAISSLLTLIPAPDFDDSTLQSLINGFPPFASYVMGRLDISGAFAIISAGVVFFLLRKIFTLGQW